MDNLKNWIRIRRDLYLQVEREVRHRLGEDVPELRRYRKFYDQEFKKKWTPSTKEELLGQIANSQILLMGDFHALHQSQKAQLRILRSLPKNRKVVLAVEFFAASDQAFIDGYLCGRISEKQFLERVDWHGNWGFPWAHYKQLMRWAQKHGVSVNGINKNLRSKKSAATLRSRDVFAGRRIADLAKKHPECLVIVVYGDLHLASSHMPREIKNFLGPHVENKILRIFQNSEEVYFKLLEKKMDASTDLVKLSRNSYCLMSVPPWVKWQNYLMYIEQAYDRELRGIEEDQLDYTDHVGRYVELMSQELGLSISKAELSVYTAQDSLMWDRLRQEYSARKLKWIESLIADEASFYLPELGLAYLARPTVNHAATLAMKYIHAKVCNTKTLLCEMPTEFEARVWQEGIGYFGSKIINPKRKADTVADIRASLESLETGEEGEEALRLALAQKMREFESLIKRKRTRRLFSPKNKRSFIIASKLLGGMLGEKLYSGYRKGLLRPEQIKIYLSQSFRESKSRRLYYEMVEVVETFPAPFRSKKEKL